MIRAAATRLALLAALLAVACVPAAAETLFAAASTARVAVTSNFSGTEITVFGSVERDAVTVSRASGYDVVVMLIGPRRTVVTRRKDSVLGLWINRDWRTFEAPSFYAVASTRPIAELAPVAQLDALEIGADHLVLPEGIPGGVEVMAGAPEFRQAFLAQSRKAGLYADYPGAVRLMGPHLFAATLPIPATVPVGRYGVRILVLADGSPVAEQLADVDVSKTGFEQTVADTAQHRPWLYGLIAVAVSLLTGWLGGVLFRRD